MASYQDIAAEVVKLYYSRLFTNNCDKKDEKGTQIIEDLQNLKYILRNRDGATQNLVCLDMRGFEILPHSRMSLI